MKSVWFVVPAHGRLDLARVCLRQLRRTCDGLEAAGIRASAVVIADDENLDTAEDLGFATVRRENMPLGRKWNDGYQLACDPAFTRNPVDYVIPFGSDDWIIPDLVAIQVERSGELRCSRRACIVNENATALQPLNIWYPGRVDFGVGVRVIPRWMLARVGYRPAEDDAKRAIDASVFRLLERALGRQPHVSFTDIGWHQIVDWKRTDGQLTPYAACKQTFAEGREVDPWEALAPHYPSESLDEMREVYGVSQEVAA